MAFIGPWEIALILGVVLVIFGPKKLPELARGLGDAVRQHRLASEGSEAPTNPSNTLNQKEPAKGNPDNILITTAKQLGVKTEGKTMEEISSEIASKTTGKY